MYLADQLPDAIALRQQIEAGELDVPTLVASYLQRIEQNHAQLNAATHVFREEALEEAQNPKAGKLSGIPISIKETLGIKGQEITSGSLLMKTVVPEEDSEVVKRLKNEGAIIVARTNIPELAMLPETDNLRFGQTANPLNLKHTSGGSSGGEAALIASGGSVLGLGSDIGGSIRYPSAFCGVVGFKSSSDAVPKIGAFPTVNAFVDSFYSIGPIARSVRDAELVYSIIADKKLSSAPPLSKIRVLIPSDKDFPVYHQSISQALEFVQQELLDLGLQEENVVISDAGKIATHFTLRMAYDLDLPLQELLTNQKGKYYPLMPELFRMLAGSPKIFWGIWLYFFGAKFMKPKSSKAARIQESIEQARKKYYDLLGDDGFLLLPSVSTLAPRHGKMIWKFMRTGVVQEVKPTIFCNVLDLPALCIPVRKFRDEKTGLIPSVSLVGKPGSESILFEAGKALEERMS